MADFFGPVIQLFSNAMIPAVFALAIGFGLYKKIPVYEGFVEGAKEGFEMAVRIIPYLVAMLVAIGMLRSSGALYLFEQALAYPAGWLGIPVEVLPMSLMRPLSGSGSIGIMTDLMKEHGPDSLIGNIASTMMGSTETTFYVLAVYYGSVKIKKPGISVTAGLWADITGLLVAVYIWLWLF
jgi:spore maturation protein B